MTISLATAADIPLILQCLSELANPPNENADSIQRYLDDDVVMVDTDLQSVCSILRNDRLSMLRVRWLLPEALSIARHAPLLAATLMASAERWPDMLDKRIEATFTQGKDADMQPDGGEGAVRAWQSFFEPHGLAPQIGRSTVMPGNPWVAWWTLRLARDKIQAVLRDA